MSGRYGWFKALLDLVFPPVCAACGVFLEQGERIRRSLTGGFGLCPKCEDSIPWHRPPYCPRCAATIRSAAVPSHVCGDCISHPPPFDSAKAVMDYDGEVLTLVHRMKFEPRPSLARYLGSLLGEMLHEDLKGLELDGIVPVPLHTKRLRERGFNQALLMSKGTAKETRYPGASPRTGPGKMDSPPDRTEPTAEAGKRQRRIRRSGRTGRKRRPMAPRGRRLHVGGHAERGVQGVETRRGRGGARDDLG